MTITIPIRTVSEANQREHWSKRHRRNKAQQYATRHALLTTSCLVIPDHPWHITLTRIAPRRLDSDNLAGSFKHVQDAVAKWLGVDDGSDRVRWTYEQRRGKPNQYAVEVAVVHDEDEALQALDRARKGASR
jgi:hypothetical protein